MEKTRRKQLNRSHSLFAIANGIGLAMLGYVALGALLAFVWEGWAASRSEAVQAAVALGRYALSLVVPFGLAGWALRRSLPPVERQPAVRQRGFVAAAFGAGVGAACLGNLLAWLMQLTAAREGMTFAANEVALPADPLARLVSFVGYSLVAALVEEVVFRGVVLRMLRPWGDVWAVWCSAALFALCHASPLQFLPALLCGGVLAIFAVETNGIGLSVTVHTCYNALALVMNHLLGGGDSALPMVVIWVALTIVGGAALPRLLAVWNRCRICWEGKRRDFYTAPFMLLATAFMVVRMLRSVLVG